MICLSTSATPWRFCASGTAACPFMAACWACLAHSGILPAPGAGRFWKYLTSSPRWCRRVSFSGGSATLSTASCGARSATCRGPLCFPAPGLIRAIHRSFTRLRLKDWCSFSWFGFFRPSHEKRARSPACLPWATAYSALPWNLCACLTCSLAIWPLAG